MAWVGKLEPILADEKIKTEYFAVADIEASDWIKFLVVGYFTKTDKGIILKTFTDLRQFFWFLFSKEQERNVIYAHFGGKYDFLFFIRTVLTELDGFTVENIIPRGSSMLSFKVTEVGESKDGYDEEGEKIKSKNIVRHTKDGIIYRKRVIEFRDSSAMLPFSLRSLCENFKVEHPKLDIDYSKIKEITPELLKYLEHDLRGLYEVIEKYYEWPLIKRAGTSYTMASQAMKVLRVFLKKPIYSLTSEHDEFVRKSYFGGRTEIFKPLFMGSSKNLLSCWDVNSLYPTVMRNNDFPIYPKEWVSDYREGEMGFYEAQVQVPEMYIPPLGTMFEIKGTKKLIFPVGKFWGNWTSIELEYAKSLGVKILKIGKGVLFKNGGPIFEDYVNELYKIREKAIKNSVDDILAKLLMNSCYGRFGLKRDRENVVLDMGQPGVEPLVEIPLDNGERIIRLMKEKKTLDKTFSNVAVANWVTSHARIFMHKLYTKKADDLYYTDTDSIFCKTGQPDGFKADKSLGALKHEYDCDSACFLLPKTYLAHNTEKIFKTGLKDLSGQDILSDRKIVMKGFDKKKIQHFEFDDFMNALEGELRLLKVTNSPKFATFKSAIRKGKFVTMLEESTKEIRSVYDKRRIIKTGNKLYDTEPLHIKNGKISNLCKKAQEINSWEINEYIKDSTDLAKKMEEHSYEVWKS